MFLSGQLAISQHWFSSWVRDKPLPEPMMTLFNDRYASQGLKEPTEAIIEAERRMCVSKFSIISSDNGLSPGRFQAIIWTNAEILLIGPLGTNFSEILIEIYTFSLKKIHLKMSFGKCQPFCFGLNESIAFIVDNAGVHNKNTFSLSIIPNARFNTFADDILNAFSCMIMVFWFKFHRNSIQWV